MPKGVYKRNAKTIKHLQDLASEQKGKTLEERYGPEKAKLLRPKFGSPGDSNPSKRPEVKAKQRAAFIKRVHPALGKHWNKTEEEKGRLSVFRKQFYIDNPDAKAALKAVVDAYWQSPGAKEKQSQAKKELYDRFPEKHPNRVIARRHLEQKGGEGYISKPQIRLYNVIKKVYPDAELEYTITTRTGHRYADIGIPSIRTDYEYDGGRWHPDIEADLKRDKELKEVHWKTIRLTAKTIDEFIRSFEEINQKKEVLV